MKTVCANCKLESDDFYKDKNRKNGLSSVCRPCKRKRNSNWYSKNKDKIRHNQFRWLYGITLDDYNKMLENQKGLCKICNASEKDNKEKLSVDHCHETGRIRGLLCSDCNLGIGMLKDSQEILKKAIEYLK